MWFSRPLQASSPQPPSSSYFGQCQMSCLNEGKVSWGAPILLKTICKLDPWRPRERSKTGRADVWMEADVGHGVAPAVNSKGLRCNSERNNKPWRSRCLQRPGVKTTGEALTELTVQQHECSYGSIVAEHWDSTAERLGLMSSGGFFLNWREDWIYWFQPMIRHQDKLSA